MKIQAHADAELSHAELQELANRLVDKRRELANLFDALNQQISAKDDCSMADAADAASVQESRVRAGSRKIVACSVGPDQCRRIEYMRAP